MAAILSIAAFTITSNRSLTEKSFVFHL